ncbi:MAG TPA: glucokinase [Candidatus Acetothermia bacterium]|nr:glucokinase [Candidatus Acetothermia bacterium]
MNEPVRSILAADVGGTKTLLMRRCWHPDGTVEETRRSYRSEEHDGLDSMLRSFLEQSPGPVQCAALAVAGPVEGHQARLTNLPWTIDATALCRRWDLGELELMNDVEALADAVPTLSPDEVHTLSPGRPDEHGTVAVAALGTGLGQAYLTPRRGGYEAHPSEGGHCSFAPTNRQQLLLLEYLLAEQEHVSVESVCSGLGIQKVFRFVSAQGGAKEERELRRQLASMADPTPTIVEHALRGTSRLCTRTMEIVVDILGAELGNLALKLLATGGVYLGGGIAPRIRPLLEEERLLHAFRRKGRLDRVLLHAPLHLILAEDGVVRGAAQRAGDRCLGSKAATKEIEQGLSAGSKQREEGRR